MRRIRTKYSYNADDIYDRPMIFDVQNKQLTMAGRKAKKKFKKRGY